MVLVQIQSFYYFLYFLNSYLNQASLKLNIREKISLEGIISFIETELKGGHDETVVEFLEDKLSYVTEMKETLNATSAEEDHMKATYSKVKEMHGV